MGQQQLLLLVLGVVVVGIALVAGISALSEGRTKADRDSAVQHAMRIVSDIQAWKIKPEAMGGAAAVAEGDFTGLTYQALGYETGTLEVYQTDNGCYAMAGGTEGATVEIFLRALDDACDPDTRVALMSVTGGGPEDIVWSYE